ncbi:MAG: hypothetical protein IT562_18840 [Alphaproteobacteria bacterium]|nr:hypothetical protein [Alphaproteobacteria bacterium]
MARDTLAVDTPARRATSTKRALPRASPKGRRDVRMISPDSRFRPHGRRRRALFGTLLRRQSVVNAGEWR